MPKKILSFRIEGDILRYYQKVVQTLRSENRNVNLSKLIATVLKDAMHRSDKIARKHIPAEENCRVDGDRLKYSCNACGKDFYRHVTKFNHVYCSAVCHRNRGQINAS